MLKQARDKGQSGRLPGRKGTHQPEPNGRLPEQRPSESPSLPCLATGKLAELFGCLHCRSDSEANYSGITGGIIYL